MKRNKRRHDLPPRVIDIHELAYLTGSSPIVIRRAGAALFSNLTGNDPDLSKALIAACDASGVEPHHMMSMMHVLALEFGRASVDSTDDEEPPSLRRGAPAPIMKRIARRACVVRSARKEKHDGESDRSLQG